MKRFDDIIQRSKEWFFKKGAAISGTRLKGIMGTPMKRKDTIYELLSEKLLVGLGEEDDENPMDRGTRLEPDAISEFELEKGVKVESTGWIESDENPKIANSPDGMISDTDDTEAVEVKCPGGKNFVKWVWEDLMSVKATGKHKLPEDYIWQVVQYFVANEKLQKLYFIIYNPDIRVYPMHIIEVTRAEMLQLVSEASNAEKVVLQEVDAMYLAFPGVKEEFDNI